MSAPVQLIIGLALAGYGVYLIFSKKRQDVILSAACIMAGAGLGVYAVINMFS